MYLSNIPFTEIPFLEDVSGESMFGYGKASLLVNCVQCQDSSQEPVEPESSRADHLGSSQGRVLLQYNNLLTPRQVLRDSSPLFSLKQLVEVVKSNHFLLRHGTLL
ncbi:hypothetical protein J6590_053102 [Homalodisca vitripennis]|nr:hypothetical protein J6590_053102 [Homalodisca vitripennis]